MDNKNRISIDPATLNKVLGVALGLILIVFEIIIFVQYFSVNANPPVWGICLLAIGSVSLTVLCFVEQYAVKSLKSRIVIYAFDFVFLLAICAVTGSTYLSGLYCVILTQLYLSVEDFKTKIITFVLTCVAFVVTCVAGWTINSIGNIHINDVVNVISGCVVGLIILVVDFVISNFLIGFYRNNVKLTQALAEADESKKRLEEAYEQLSETAVLQERNRIARDIHDNAGHSMTAVIMQTEAAKLLIDTNPEEAKAKIISANIQAKNALDQMRDSVHLLAGRTAGEVSLKEEIEEILAQTMDGTDINIRSDIGDFSLTAGRRRFIANSLKECLANGMRHGGANAFYVELSCVDGLVTLTVSDNGCGLPPDFKEGFGLKGIREKAAAFDGEIVYESESGDGCEITITIRTE